MYFLNFVNRKLHAKHLYRSKLRLQASDILGNDAGGCIRFAIFVFDATVCQFTHEHNALPFRYIVFGKFTKLWLEHDHLMPIDKFAPSTSFLSAHKKYIQ